MIAGLAAAAVLLPAWVLIERRSRAPMLDLSLFNNRLFAAATASAFINGLARFALMFLFVFYFQGAQSNSPIEAGIKLIPLALGMLVASPLAGIYADRHGSRTLAALGMLVSAAGLAGMTTLGVHTPYWQSAVWLALVGVGSGMFNSPNTAAMMGAVPAQRRGIAAGARTLVQNTGAVLSIAFVLAIVTSSVPKADAVRRLLGPGSRTVGAEASAVHRQHARRPVGSRGDLARRCGRMPAAPQPRAGHRAAGRRRSAIVSAALRIGDVAKLAGTTPRTIRYYEEIGLLAAGALAPVRRASRSTPTPRSSDCAR